MGAESEERGLGKLSRLWEMAGPWIVGAALLTVLIGGFNRLVGSAADSPTGRILPTARCGTEPPHEPGAASVSDAYGVWARCAFGYDPRRTLSPAQEAAESERQRWVEVAEECAKIKGRECEGREVDELVELTR